MESSQAIALRSLLESQQVASLATLHTCNKIRNYTQMARPGGFTGRGYIKVCSNDLESLHQYARNKGGRPDGSFSSKCRSCSP